VTFINFEKDYLPEWPTDSVGFVCCRAREILGGYSLEARDVDSYSDIDSRIIVSDVITPEPKHDDTKYEEDAILYETFPVDINDEQSVKLSNRPYLIDANGKLQPYKRPGYVALHVEPNDINPLDFIPSASTCDQIILRLPRGENEEAPAIFRGFSLDDAARIDHDKTEVAATAQLVEDLGISLYSMFTGEDGLWSYTLLGNSPEPPIEMDYTLENILSNGTES
jgi:hypothetical protein